MARIHLSKADVTELEEKYVLEALRSGWVAPLGPEVDAFEREVAERVGVGHALALASGTAALHLALLELGAGPGTAVVLPTMTFVASANAVAYTGAEPVFVDAGPDGNVDPALLLDAVDTLRREGTTVAAAMTVDLFGRCAEYDELVDAVAERGVPLVEDAAEALGATYRGRAAGSFGKAAALSFNGNKIMTTSGGGMLLSDDEDLIGRARYLSTQARQPVAYYEHTEIGYNYRLSNILAALGRAQLSRLDEMIERRRAIRETYAQAVRDIDDVHVLAADERRGDDGDNCWLTCVTLDHTTGTDVAAVLARLDAAEIEARHLWKPMHLQPVFADRRSWLTGVSERLFLTGITLPSGSALRDDEVSRVVETLQDALRAGAR
ncbi:MAG: aminotransferase class I/II-fold pyridoxal phosphate-dependent enzyme [Cellulomonas sp.]|uniref:DegT/DnrJ/EryC1/StrS family aminotransferase n=1 Tax=Cellulomonas sp. TaxID=40001 RepID=UPI0019ECE9B0|nr:aminotransferase class I/II-fold pyridoxal phosphate-dependent enzyme [Cellulomonas sp.]